MTEYFLKTFWYMHFMVQRSVGSLFFSLPSWSSDSLRVEGRVVKDLHGSLSGHGRQTVPLPFYDKRISGQVMLLRGFPGGSYGKESACNAGDLGSIPELGRSPERGHGNPLQYSCLENPHGPRSLVDYSPWGRKKSDMTEWLSTVQCREQQRVTPTAWRST